MTDISGFTIEPDQLGRLLGQCLNYQGIPCRVIEILDDGPALVLQDAGSGTTIQANQHGEANRRVPRVFTVDVRNPQRDGLNPALPELGDWLE